MSLTVIKPGLLDTLQDGGRFGAAYLGIGAGGAMDPFSAELAGALLGKERGWPVLELHFPAAALRFDVATLFCLAGAALDAVLDGQPVPLNQPVLAAAGTQLAFGRQVQGQRTYLALAHPLAIAPWHGSYSTDLQAGAGGWHGRALRKGDVLPYTAPVNLAQRLNGKAIVILPWQAQPEISAQETSFLRGPEWELLTEEAKEQFTTRSFLITPRSDRMGYRLSGPALEAAPHAPLLSSGVGFGTVQLLPDGQLIVLMAAHGTTGGYPRIAQVCTDDLPALAQRGPRDFLHFQLAETEAAEDRVVRRAAWLEDVRLASRWQLQLSGYATD